MNEIWKPIKGYEGKYEVSNLGNVRSLDYNNTGIAKVLKKKVNINNYNKMKKERDFYKSVIDKAIEYINENEDVDLYDDVGSAFCRKLLEILKGKDENSN